jgi:hypothetical protein
MLNLHAAAYCFQWQQSFISEVERSHCLKQNWIQSPTEAINRNHFALLSQSIYQLGETV